MSDPRPFGYPAGVPRLKLPPEATIRTRTLARADIKDRFVGMNKTEAKRANDLDFLLKAGEIAAWWWESFTFEIGSDCRYTPDFVIQENDGSLRVEETKGFFREDALVKVKTFARQFPFPIRILKLAKGGGWIITDITP